MEFSAQIENYLKYIYLLQTRYNPVPTTKLAEKLGVSAAAVTSMIRKLVRLELLDHEPYKGAQLTAKGKAVALKVLRAHRLWELYLVEVLGIPWDQAHIEAERLEHALSDELADRLDEVLGHPTTDPHGHPIPARNGQLPPLFGVPLTELLPGERGIILRIRDDTPELLRYLGELGVYPGKSVVMQKVAPFNGPLYVRIEETDQVLGHEAAGHIVVQKDEGE